MKGKTRAETQNHPDTAMLIMLFVIVLSFIVFYFKLLKDVYVY